MAASTTMAVVDTILKEVYEDKIRDQLQSEVVTLKRIERSSEGVTHEVGGKYVTFPIRTRRNHGIGARNENEPLPKPRSQKYADARVRLKYLYGSASLTGQTFELAEKNFQAFASALSQEMDGLKQTLVKDTNRQVYGTSTGVMATVDAGTGSAGFVHSFESIQYLEVGMIVDVLDSTGAVFRVQESEILDIDTSTNDVTFDKSFDTDTGDVLARFGSYGKEKTGFKEIVSATGTLYDINPSTEPVWKSAVNSNGGTPRALSEGLMIKLADDIRTKGGKTTVIFTSLGVRRSYFNLLAQQRRYNNTQSFEGGFNGLSFTTDWGDIPIISDFDCQPGRMYFMNEKEIKLYEANDWSFMDRDGSKWQRIMTAEGDYDAYKTTMYKYCELGTHRRNSHGLLSDIQEAA